MLVTSATTEIIDFIAGENPSKVIEFKASAKTKQRVFQLIEQSKFGKLNEKDQAELDHYFLLEHLIRLAKIRAYQMLKV